MGKVREHFDLVYEGNRAKNDTIKALGRYVIVDEDYAQFLMWMDVKDKDPLHMSFFANAKADGNSYVFQNGLDKPVMYEKEEFDINGVENVRLRNSNALKTTARKKIRKDLTTLMDNGVKIEPCVQVQEESEVEILENVGATLKPFVALVDRCSDIVDSGYRKELLNVLMRPYDEKEFKRLWKDVKKPLNRRGDNHLTLHKGVNRQIKRTKHDKHEWLNIMRGFFFLLEHVTREDAFVPWEDAECLRTKPEPSRK